MGGGGAGFGGGFGGGGGLGGGMNVSAMMPDGPQGRGGRQCLVLYTGATFYGRLSVHGLNYKVQQQNGELVIPCSQVRVVADSAAEAYEKQRRAMKQPTAEEVLALARWCQEQGLRDEARQLCGVVLKADPDSKEALRILKKAESRGRPMWSPAEAPTGTDPLVVTAAGISPGANADFIRRIQPLLINSCGLSGCHAADSKQEFQLSAYRLNDGLRYRSDENLAEVLKRITLASPERSPLLTAGRKGGVHREVFAGPGGEESRRQLEAWVLRVAIELSWVRQAGQVGPGPAGGMAGGAGGVPGTMSAGVVDKSVFPEGKFKLDGKAK